MAIVFFFQLGQLFDTLTCLLFLTTDITLHPFVSDDGTGLNGSRKHHSIERFATTKGYIYLTRSKREAGINYGSLEGQTLTLMNGDGPCQTKWQLTELALYFRLNDSCLWVQLILCILPLQRFDINSLTIARTEHTDTTVADFHDFTDAPIIISVFSRGIVLHKHHLRTLFQHQEF